MHMADALISPVVGGVMWGASGGLLAWCSHRVRQAAEDRLIPMMGVLGAFIFAAQMINFTIPGTGSSGHLGGGLILAALLGPHAAFIVIASVLTVQALFFADGGLLALGCNLFNLGYFPAFIAYPLIYRPLIGRGGGEGCRYWGGTLLAAVVGLQLGSLCVVIQTAVSGISDLPIATFLWLMQPIHLGIGIVEGIATGAVVLFVRKARPGLLGEPMAEGGWRRALAGLAVATVVVGGLASWFASTHPDGLEWSMSKAGGREEIEVPKGGVHGRWAAVQEKTAVLPDYGFKAEPDASGEAETETEPVWPAPSAGTSLSGVVGGGITLLVAMGLGGLARWRRHPDPSSCTG